MYMREYVPRHASPPASPARHALEPALIANSVSLDIRLSLCPPGRRAGAGVPSEAGVINELIDTDCRHRRRLQQRRIGRALHPEVRIGRRRAMATICITWCYLESSRPSANLPAQLAYKYRSWCVNSRHRRNPEAKETAALWRPIWRLAKTSERWTVWSSPEPDQSIQT